VRAEDFVEPVLGELVRSPQGVLAYVPPPLPPALAYDAALVRCLSEADTRLAELAGMGRQVPNPHLLIAPYMRQEAVLSSRIEGTQASLSELFEEELRPDGPERAEGTPADADAREVRNYVRALEHGIQRLTELPLSLRLVRELHETLMQGVRGGDRNPGAFRTHQNFIGTRGSRIETATFVPPPPDRLPACLDAWERFLHERHTLPDLIQCALMHAHFETLHPFADGNGRVGRLLVTLFLVERQRLPQPLLYLSAYIEANKVEYYERLQRTRTHGDWRGWLIYFLQGVEITARLAAGQVTALIAMRDAWRSRFSGQAGVLALIDALFANPITDAKRAAREMRKSDPTARAAIAALQAAGLLREVTGRRWGRWFVAHEIVDLLEKPEADLRAPQIVA
jgi:Fic family protein